MRSGVDCSGSALRPAVRDFVPDNPFVPRLCEPHVVPLAAPACEPLCVGTTGDVLHIAVCDEAELVLSTEDATLQHACAFWRDVEFLPDPVDKAACAVGLSAAAGSCAVVTLATANVLTLHPGEERASLRRELLAVEFDKLGFDLVGLNVRVP